MSQVINSVVSGLNHVSGNMFNYAAAVFVQTAILVLVLYGLDLLLRKRVRAIVRYCLWLLVLVKLLLPPTLSVPTGIGYWVGDQLPTSVRVSTYQEEDSLFGFRPLDYSHRPGTSRPETGIITTGEDHEAFIVSETPSFISLSWQSIVLLVWVGGVLVFLALLMQRIRFVRGVIAGSHRAPDSTYQVLQQCQQQMSIRRPIRLQCSDAISSPAVCGFRHPTILMPTSLLEKLSHQGLRATLIHELAHIKRADLWINAIQTGLQVAYFYNPFVWFANAIIRRVCEEAVDETVVVALEGDAKSYSNTLINIGEIALWKTDLGLRLIGVAESRKALQWRIRHMLTRPIPKSVKLGLPGLTGLLMIAALLLPMAKGQKLDQVDEPIASMKQEGSSQSPDGVTASADVERIKALLSARSGVNDTGGDRYDRTLLHLAARRGQNEVVEFLVASGADINAKSQWGQTPLHLAANAGHKDSNSAVSL
ncbi:M56 family metallopeptidase [Planctomycetota bacterium]